MIGRQAMVTNALNRHGVAIQRLLFTYLIGNIDDKQFTLALERMVLGEYDAELDRIELSESITE